MFTTHNGPNGRSQNVSPQIAGRYGGPNTHQSTAGCSPDIVGDRRLSLTNVNDVDKYQAVCESRTIQLSFIYILELKI